MPRYLAVTKLADGRLQMWYALDSLLSSWQTSLDPQAPWTPLTPFDPAPPGQVVGVAAGHSPNGRAQLWTISSDPTQPSGGRLQTTWKTSFEADSDWTAWQAPFIPDPGPVKDVGVGQLSDGRMQVWTTAASEFRLMSIWKMSKDPGASWTAWQDPFLPDPGGAEGVAVGQLSDGRLKLWVIGRAGYQREVLTSEKKTSDPDAGWTDWQVFANLSV